MDLGHAQIEGSLHDEGGGTPLYGRTGEVVTVALHARDAEEQRPRLDLTAVVGEARDLALICAGRHAPSPQGLDGGQLCELHGCAPLAGTAAKSNWGRC